MGVKRRIRNVVDGLTVMIPACKTDRNWPTDTEPFPYNNEHSLI